MPDVDRGHATQFCSYRCVGDSLRHWSSIDRWELHNVFHKQHIHSSKPLVSCKASRQGALPSFSCKLATSCMADVASPATRGPSSSSQVSGMGTFCTSACLASLIFCTFSLAHNILWSFSECVLRASLCSMCCWNASSALSPSMERKEALSHVGRGYPKPTVSYDVPLHFFFRWQYALHLWHCYLSTR